MLSILFQTESHFPVNREKVKSAIIAQLTRALKGKVEVSVSIVGDRKMHELNRTYRHVDDTTDVLSFPLNDTADQKGPYVDFPDGVLRLGDIIVSYPQAVEAASAENKMVDEKIVELVLHGLNHLLGIHHPE